MCVNKKTVYFSAGTERDKQAEFTCFIILQRSGRHYLITVCQTLCVCVCGGGICL